MRIEGQTRQTRRVTKKVKTRVDNTLLLAWVTCLSCWWKGVLTQRVIRNYQSECLRSKFCGQLQCDGFCSLFSVGSLLCKLALHERCVGRVQFLHGWSPVCDPALRQANLSQTIVTWGAVFAQIIHNSESVVSQQTKLSRSSLGFVRLWTWTRKFPVQFQHFQSVNLWITCCMVHARCSSLFSRSDSNSLALILNLWLFFTLQLTYRAIPGVRISPCIRIWIWALTAPDSKCVRRVVRVKFWPCASVCRLVTQEQRALEFECFRELSGNKTEKSPPQKEKRTTWHLCGEWVPVVSVDEAYLFHGTEMLEGQIWTSE